MSAEIIDHHTQTRPENIEYVAGLDFDGVTYDPVRPYLYRISKTPLLKAEEEVELAKDIEVGLYAEQLLTDNDNEYGEDKKDLELLVKLGRAAYERMVSANLRLVVSMAKKYQASGVPLLDLIQEGNLALMHAVKKFDYTRGCKLSTAATPWIRKAIITSTYQQSARIPMGVKEAEKLNVIRKQCALLFQELERFPTNQEIAAVTNIQEDVIEELVSASRLPRSIDVPAIPEAQDSPSIAEFLFEQNNLYLYDTYDLGDDSHIAGQSEDSEQVRSKVNQILQTLQERDRLMIEGLFGINTDGITRTREELAKAFEIDPFYLKQKCDKIIQKLGKIAQHTFPHEYNDDKSE